MVIVSFSSVFIAIARIFSHLGARGKQTRKQLEDTVNREFQNLKLIRDNHPKYVVLSIRPVCNKDATDKFLLQTRQVDFVECRRVVVPFKEHYHINGGIDQFPFYPQILVAEYHGLRKRIVITIHDV